MTAGTGSSGIGSSGSTAGIESSGTTAGTGSSGIGSPQAVLDCALLSSR
ncbi:unnamed protein product [Staurois parvus]|uniref:Uncharacterized protein n=1 Tax=Staurois parvus TaxID=386267 RepID=A0ABN9BQE5_9NEOB|nr:unnamed protein product [Staurois parvus]